MWWKFKIRIILYTPLFTKKVERMVWWISLSTPTLHNWLRIQIVAHSVKGYIKMGCTRKLNFIDEIVTESMTARCYHLHMWCSHSPSLPTQMQIYSRPHITSPRHKVFLYSISQFDPVLCHQWWTQCNLLHSNTTGYSADYLPLPCSNCQHVVAAERSQFHP